ncbi:MAG: class I SAM-dependent methyltransferase [Roseitalea porphyridii]|uniref:class I SAM-dependent methyltransferase n=1 Tax=Roseitalea porphyridii TaxID=1852022 RepID=UPI0032ECA199
MTATSAGAEAMDGIYRYQRHIYDLTRRYYLLGRNELITMLQPPAGGSVLEIGCGTARNLVLAARRYPDARFFGLDISAEMLKSAEATLRNHGLEARVTLAQGDATRFDARALFGQPKFDRVFCSYSLSMIPGWEAALREAGKSVGPGGELHVVDFGGQADLPDWFGRGLRNWLARFHVTPRQRLQDAMSAMASETGGTLSFRSIYKDYARLGSIRLTA